MDKHAMLNEAMFFCPKAAKALKDEDWRQACVEILKRCKQLDMALQSLTPGGSEFVGDPDRCVAFVKDERQRAQQRFIEAIRTSRDAKAEVLREIKWAYDTLQEINPSNYDHDDVCNLNAASVEVLLRLGNILNESGIDLEEVEG